MASVVSVESTAVSPIVCGECPVTSPPKSLPDPSSGPPSAVALVKNERAILTPDTWTEKCEGFERMNSIRVTNGNFDSYNSCKRLVPSRSHELHESKVPFVTRIEFIRSKFSNLSPHVYGVTADRRGGRPEVISRRPSVERRSLRRDRHLSSQSGAIDHSLRHCRCGAQSDTAATALLPWRYVSSNTWKVRGDVHMRMNWGGGGSGGPWPLHFIRILA